MCSTPTLLATSHNFIILQIEVFLGSGPKTHRLGYVGNTLRFKNRKKIERINTHTLQADLVFKVFVRMLTWRSEFSFLF